MYYIRLDKEARPAPHGLVEALFQKRNRPEIQSYISWQNVDGPNGNNVTINFSNKSNSPAQHCSFLIDVYNVHNVDASTVKFFVDDFKQYKRLKWWGIMDYPRVMAHNIATVIEIQIVHKSKPYIIFSSCWCSEMSFPSRFWLMNPSDATILHTHEDISFDDALAICLG